MVLKAIKRMLACKEVKAVLGVLDEADQRFNCSAFTMVKNHIETAVLSQPSSVAQQIRNGLSARQAVYSMIANVAGDLAESGEFHIHRGSLNPMTGGTDLMTIFETSVDEMVLIGAINEEDAVRQKSQLIENIKTVG